MVDSGEEGKEIGEGKGEVGGGEGNNEGEIEGADITVLCIVQMPQGKVFD